MIYSCIKYTTGLLFITYILGTDFYMTLIILNSIYQTVKEKVSGSQQNVSRAVFEYRLNVCTLYIHLTEVGCPALLMFARQQVHF